MTQVNTSKNNAGNNNNKNSQGIVKKFGNEEDIVYTLQLKLEFDQKVGKPTINVYSNSIDDAISKIEEAYSKLKTRFESNGIPIAPISVTHSQQSSSSQPAQTSTQQQIKEVED